MLNYNNKTILQSQQIQHQMKPYQQLQLVYIKDIILLKKIFINFNNFKYKFLIIFIHFLKFKIINYNNLKHI